MICRCAVCMLLLWSLATAAGCTGLIKALQPCFLFNLRDLFVCLCACLSACCVCCLCMSLPVSSPTTHSALMFTVCPVSPEQWVPSRCAVTAAGSHQLGSQVLLAGRGTAFNERWSRPVESPRGGSALGNREQRGLQRRLSGVLARG